MRTAEAMAVSLATAPRGASVAPLPLAQKVVYGAGDLIIAIRQTAFQFYLLPFYTDVMVLAPWLAGLGKMLGLVWDGVNDPITGFLSDRTRSRFGRRRPFLLAAALLLGLAFGFLWSPPSSLGEGYTGKTSIGVVLAGKKDGKDKRAIIYNVCDHADAYRETGAQAVSYTTGVPPVVGAMMLFKGHWKGAGVYNVEQLPPKPFMDEIGKQGLPWHMHELGAGEQSELFAVAT